jgi:beta-glucosidase
MAPGGDRVSLRLSSGDEALIAAAAERHDRVVVVVVTGSAVVMPWVESVQATLVSWYSGVEGGSALGDVVIGRAEPGGRLPFAIPTDPDHLVEFDRNATAATYDLFHGQWKLDRDGRTAQFPFGWGLSYADVSVVAADLAEDGTTVSVRVANGSDRETSTVVFVHAGLDGSDVERPQRRLVGFARIAAPAAGEAAAGIALDWSALDLRLEGAWVTERGVYTLEVGQHAHDPAAIPLTVERF